MTTLREAAQQALAFTMRDFATMRDFEAARAVLHDDLRAALAQQAEPDLSRCPQCNGPADNGFDRSIPPSPYLCTKCMAEPVEPVATLTAQRDALLEALRALLSYANVLEMRLLDADGEHRAMQKARAAIKAAEETK